MKSEGSSSTSPADLSDAYLYCKQTTRRHAKSFYFSAQFLPQPKRQAIYAIYALCRHVDDAVDEAEAKSAHDARAAVEQWSQDLDAVYSGKKTYNPILIAWADMLKRYAIKQELPLELMRGVLMDTYISRYKTWDDLRLYCHRVASVVGLMSSEVLGYQGPETLKYAEALGLAMQLTNILRDVREDALMGRIYLPQEEMRKFGVTEAAVMRGEVNQSFISLMQFEISGSTILPLKLNRESGCWTATGASPYF
ncbi:MAG: phytoene/squalene synthase family protein [Pyrinomonadaceae bacterium]